MLGERKAHPELQKRSNLLKNTAGCDAVQGPTFINVLVAVFGWAVYLTKYASA
jgi:hypothetical protein